MNGASFWKRQMRRITSRSVGTEEMEEQVHNDVAFLISVVAIYETFNSLLLLKAFRQDRLLVGSTNFVAKVFSNDFTALPELDLSYVVEVNRKSWRVSFVQKESNANEPQSSRKE